MYFNYDHLNFLYEPFPIGLAKPLMDKDTYRQFVDNWPDKKLFKSMPQLGNKFSLSQKFNSDEYHEFIKSNPLWRDFHSWIKSDDFVDGVMDALKSKNIDLGHKNRTMMQRVRKRTKNLVKGSLAPTGTKLKARFEFQMMPANGGHILPHTDTPQKIVTLVVSMMQPGEWDPAWGGATDLNMPKDITQSFNYLNRYDSFENMDVLNSFEFTENQAVIFVKTFNSWHSVQPMQAKGTTAMRKTLIINIEKPKGIVL
jgi:hypothetical protein